MEQHQLSVAMRQAQKMVQEVNDPQMRAAAFGVVLSTLLGRDLAPRTARRAKPTMRHEGLGSPDTAPARVLGLKGEDFFKQQRTLTEVREELRSKAWHYPLTALSGVMQTLVQARELRRLRVKVGNRRVWKYSDY